MKNLKSKKAISLIVLVITIIVIIILAAAVILTLSNKNIVGNAVEAVFKQDMSEYKSHSVMYASDEVLNNKSSKDKINAGIDGYPAIDTVLSGVNDKYPSKLTIEKASLTYNPDKSDKNDLKKAKWAFQVGLKVKGYETEEEIDDDINKVPIIPKGEYVENNGVYVCQPDLTGFNKEKTYFATFDDGKKDAKIGKSINFGASEGWFDYANKKWANVVVKGDSSVSSESWFVWIPRYVYKINSSNKIELKYVDTNNDYKDAQTGVVTNYTDSTEYLLSDAFTYGGKALPGYWMSKYEVADIPSLDTNYITAFNCKTTLNSIAVTSITNTFSVSNITEYEYYLDGKLVGTGGTTYEYTNLESGKEYEVAIKFKFSGASYGGITKKVTTLSPENTRIIYANTDIQLSNDKIVVSEITKSYVENCGPITYEYYLNDVKKGATTSNTFEIIGLPEANTYNILIKLYDEKNQYISQFAIVNGKPDLKDANAPDLTGFNKDRTYYVTYVDGSKDPIIGNKISTNNPPADWYDYNKKKWANIAVIDGDVNDLTVARAAFFVWIPRYEYIVEGNNKIYTSFIEIDKVIATPGYKISDAFTYAGRQLPGYWMSKYEVAD